MNCPKCGDRWKVIDSRHAESSAIGEYDIIKYVDGVSDAVSWYTADWVARKRCCSNCGHEDRTVELTLEDLLAITRYNEEALAHVHD